MPRAAPGAAREECGLCLGPWEQGTEDWKTCGDDTSCNLDFGPADCSGDGVRGVGGAIA